MNITRHNYEEFFLLYVDNELNIAQRKAVEAFVEENPDLRSELIMLQQSVLPADEHITFNHKQDLLKMATDPNPVNETNCEEYFILYSDDELTNEQKDQVEQFVYRHPQYQESFELYQQVRLMPDTSVVFPDKYALYRKEEEDKAPVIRIRWWRIAAAAAVLLFTGSMGWYLATHDPGNAPDVESSFAYNDSGKATPPVQPIQEQTQQPVIAEQKNTPDQKQDVAITADKKNQTDNQQKPATTVSVRSPKAVDVAGINKKDEKNKETPRNIPEVLNVPHTEAVVKADPKRTIEGKSIDPGLKADQTKEAIVDKVLSERDLAALTIPTTAQKPTVIPEPENPGEPYPINDNKKNKMRGFFRKVSRVFDKATNADPDNEKSSIRIASFEFALK
ncbi:hypothetical protein HB364_03720 [Pseudoflavitalea sp. X16]|uniref:anti-sigma factor family protein n=1 Tax=Paraflavitalea devenefica TaxID=2716334 RepID=UPI00141E6CAA|nr:hypothetical protein [Paraflavitalea devenefica]NII24169.1 hypothetical protein [Paraflavitalea devenefica]